MSGGSLGYLCNRTTAELLESENLGFLNDAERELISRGYIDVAQDVSRLIEYIHRATTRIDVLRTKLSPVLKAVEWRLNSDIGDETLAKVIRAYQNMEEE